MSRDYRWAAAYVWGLAVRGGEVVAKLTLYMLAARLLNQQECGVLFICMTWVVLAGTLSRFGMERALSRLIPAELALDQGVAARRALVRGGMIVSVAGLGLGIATALAAPFAAAHLFHAGAALPGLRASGVVIPALALAVTLCFVLVGFHRPVLSQVLQNLLWPLGMLLALLAGMRDAAGLMLVMAATQAVAIAASLLAVAGHKRQLAADAPLPAAAQLLPPLWRTAWPLYVVELVQVSISTLPVLILGIYADPAAVSVFSIALRASMLVLVVLLSVSAVASPRFAASHRQGDDVQLAAVNRRTQLLGAGLGLFVCATLAAGAPLILTLIGRNFAGGASALLMLLAGQSVNAVYAGQDGMLAMTGRGNALRLLNLVQLGVMLVLSFTLIPRFGAIGAALVTATATAQGALGTAMAVKTYFPRAAPRLAPPVPGALRNLLLRLAA